MELTIKSYPLNEIDIVTDVPNTYVSGEMIQDVWIRIEDAPTDEYIEVGYNGVIKTLLITDECRYEPVDIGFQNKHGAIQIMPFFKAKRDTITTTSETYEGNRPIGKHQFIRYNVNAKVKFLANSGFITEDKNEVVQQLLMSERVWLLDNGLEVPLNVTTSSLEYKTRQNDRLINYAIEFEHAYYENNNV